VQRDGVALLIRDRYELGALNALGILFIQTEPFDCIAGFTKLRHEDITWRAKIRKFKQIEFDQGVIECFLAIVSLLIRRHVPRFQKKELASMENRHGLAVDCAARHGRQPQNAKDDPASSSGKAENVPKPVST
jgi:hypothetical protein